MRLIKWSLGMGSVLAGVCAISSTVLGAEAPITPNQIIVEAIECTGNTHTDCELLTRELNLQPGDKIDEDEIQNARTRIQLYGFFSDVDIVLKKGTERGKGIVEIQVVEKSAYFSEVSLGAASSRRRFYNSFYPDLDPEIFTAPTFKERFTLGNKNLFGKGKVLRGQIEGAQSGLVGTSYQKFLSYYGVIEYADPALFGNKKYFFNLGGQLRLSHGDSVSNAYYSFYTGIGRRIWDYSFVGVNASADPGQTRFLDSIDYTLESEYYSTAAYYGWNSLDDLIFPTQGSIFNLALQWDKQKIRCKHLTSTISDPHYYCSGNSGRFSLNTSFRKFWAPFDASVISLNLSTIQGIGAWATTELGPQGFGSINTLDALPVSVGYGYDFRKNRAQSWVRNGRAKLDLGFDSPGIGWSTITGWVGINPAARLGVVLDSPNIGILNLFFAYSYAPRFNIAGQGRNL